MEQLLIRQQHPHYKLIIIGLKMSIAFIGFFLGLAIGIKDTGYPYTVDDIYNSLTLQEFSLDTTQTQQEIVQLNQNNPIHQELSRYIQETLIDRDNFHAVGDNIIETNEREQKRNTLCGSLDAFCNTIVFEGSWDPQTKYRYGAISIYLLSLIEKNLNTPNKTLAETLRSLTLRLYPDDKDTSGTCLAERRGCANHSQVILNIFKMSSPLEFAHVLMHEVAGHIVDLGVLIGQTRQLDKTFTEFGQESFALDDPSLGYYAISRQGESVRKKGASIDDFCSLYSMTNVFEDFAECAIMYKHHNLYFRVLALENRVLRKKYQYLANIYGGAYIFSNPAQAEIAKRDNSTRVWDLTKLY